MLISIWSCFLNLTEELNNRLKFRHFVLNYCRKIKSILGIAFFLEKGQTIEDSGRKVYKLPMGQVMTTVAQE